MKQNSVFILYLFNLCTKWHQREAGELKTLHPKGNTDNC